eukprot:2057009-Prymnesium_polylepis.1
MGLLELAPWPAGRPSPARGGCDAAALHWMRSREAGDAAGSLNDGEGRGGGGGGGGEEAGPVRLRGGALVGSPSFDAAAVV